MEDEGRKRENVDISPRHAPIDFATIELSRQVLVAFRSANAGGGAGEAFVVSRKPATRRYPALAAREQPCFLGSGSQSAGARAQLDE